MIFEMPIDFVIIGEDDALKTQKTKRGNPKERKP
jgi:hypothetical protein